MLYAVSPLIQSKEVEKYCFGKCGKILMGILSDEELGELGCCRIKRCRYEEKHTKVIGAVGSEKICLRKLKEGE